MKCLSDGILRAQLDGELSTTEALEVNHHLAACADCRRRRETMADDAERVGELLATLAPARGEAPTDAHSALARFRSRISHSTMTEAPGGSLLSRLFSRRLAPVWGAVGALGLAVALLGLAPAHTWGQRFLAMLRVQRITVVPVDLEALNRPAADAARRSMAKLLSDEVVVTMKAGEPQPVSTREEATKLANFDVRLLGSRADAPRIKVLGEQAFHMTINRERLQAILDEAGRSDLRLPPAVDGATVAAHIPKIVLAQYGSCPHAPYANNTYPQGGDGTSCIDLAQSPSPTVSVPPNLNMAELAELGLELGGMSAQQAHAFSQTVDWTSTLVIGIPHGISYQTVEVDGVEGTLMEMARHDKPRNSLLWVKDGIVYALTVSGSAQDALSLAGSLD